MNDYIKYLVWVYVKNSQFRKKIYIDKFRLFTFTKFVLSLGLKVGIIHIYYIPLFTCKYVPYMF